jgi:hypothetical protein
MNGQETAAATPPEPPAMAAIPARRRPAPLNLLVAAGRRLRRLYRSPFFSPVGFIIRAAELTLIYLLLHAVGLRQYVGVLSGSFAPGSVADTLAAGLGILYICFYLATVLVAPILVLAAAILAACSPLVRPRENR